MATNDAAYPNTWQGVSRAARDCGCRYDQLVAAQWALESGFGRHAPGHNYFGLKGPGTKHKTSEVLDGQWTQLNESFMVFADLQEATQYLVERWYKDFKGYLGVDRAPSLEDAAQELVKQGYATDPAYSRKLLQLVRDHGSTAEPGAPAVLRFEVIHPTVLKVAPIDSRYLSSEGKRTLALGDVLEVRQLEEIPSSGHNWVVLRDGSRWAIYQPHLQVIAPPLAPPSQKATAAARVIDWQDFTYPLGTYLTIGEVLQYDHRRRPAAGSAAAANLLEVARQFDAIRSAWGSALGVTSGYRPEPINRQVGGVPGSMHTEGRALDIYPLKGTIAAFHDWLVHRWSGGYGDGRHRGFIHIDTRGGGVFCPDGGVKPWRIWTY